MNHPIDQGQFSRSKQNSVDILFKGLKRKINQRSYSKLKNSYKKKPIQNYQLQVPFTSNVVSRPKLKLSIVSNKILDPEQAHEELLKLKQANHKLSEENAQLLRKVRKQVKIEEIYRKKLQGRQLIDLQYLKVMEIKLLLEVERLENQLEQRQKVYQDKFQFIKSKKNLFKNEIIEKRISLYQLMIDSPEDIIKISKEKKLLLSKKDETIDQFTINMLKVKSVKQQKSEALKKIQNEIKELRQKFKIVEAQSKRDKNNVQMSNITNLMSTLITGSQKSPVNKEASTAILKNNMSSISVKNRNNTEQIEKEISKIKEQYEMMNNKVQQFMDEKIKQKILIHKQIHAIEQNQRKQRDIQNRNIISKTGTLGKQTNTTNSRINRSNHPAKSTLIVIE